MKLIETARRALSREGLLLKKHSPHIFFVVGIVGVVGGTVLACKATLKLEKTLDECKDDLNQAKCLHTDTETLDKTVAFTYVKNTVKVAKLYAPAAGVMTLSILSLTNSHVILTKRNTALMSAYSLLQTAYENYRQRVRENLGEEKELEIYRGEVKQLKKGELVEQDLVDPNKLSPYARFFDVGNDNWHKDAELNRFFVQCQQQQANNMLHARGHLFLNEVYDMLGLERSRAGSIIGWVIDKNDKSTHGFVDFGIFRPDNSPFVNNWERSILLDFNVDGVIYNRI